MRSASRRRTSSVDACVVTRFGRTHETAALALGDRDVPLIEEPLLDDIYIGELEGRTLDDYRDWKRAHTRADAFPGGESLDAAARRYAAGFRRLLELPHRRVLVVCHEIPVRYAVNAAGGSDDLDGPVHDIVNADAVPVRRGRARTGSGGDRAGSSDRRRRDPRRSAGERTRTSKGLAAQRDLNPPRLPVPPHPRGGQTLAPDEERERLAHAVDHRTRQGD